MSNPLLQRTGFASCSTSTVGLVNPIEWIESKVACFRDLREADRQQIFQFLLLWSLYEAKVHATKASANLILAKVHEWSTQGEIDRSRFEAHLEYFRHRYFVKGELSSDFSRLRLQPNNKPDLVKSVLSGATDNTEDCFVVLLIIAYRLRNNLFHGVKWADGIQGQSENFNHANTLLIYALEINGL